MYALFAKARALSSAAPRPIDGDEGSTRHALAVAAAQSQLLDGLLDGVEARVEEAARAGGRELVLLEFEGSDTYAGFHTLYLVKGPRQPESDVVPLLDGLRRRLAPFRVTHAWRPGSVHNRVVLSWA